MSDSREFLAGFLATALISLVAFLALTEAVIRTRIEPVHPYLRKLEMIQTGTTTDVVLGSSMAQWGFSGQTGFNNLAQSGNVDTMTAMAQLYFEHRPAGRVIIMAAPHEFNSRYAAGRDGGQLRRHLTHTMFPLRVFDPFFGGDIVGYWQNYAKSRSFIGGIPLSDGSHLQTRRYDLTKPPAGRLVEARRLLQTMAPQMERTKADVLTRFTALIEFLKEKGGHVCLVAFPVAPEFAGLAAGERAFGAARAAYVSLAATEGVPYVDLFDEGESTSLFWDSVHLNADGAHRFSPLIVNRCFVAPQPLSD